MKIQKKNKCIKTFTRMIPDISLIILFLFIIGCQTDNPRTGFERDGFKASQEKEK